MYSLSFKALKNKKFNLKNMLNIELYYFLMRISCVDYNFVN